MSSSSLRAKRLSSSAASTSRTAVDAPSYKTTAARRRENFRVLCEYCPAEVSYTNRARHNRERHGIIVQGNGSPSSFPAEQLPEEVGQYICEVCMKSYTRISSLIRHKRTRVHRETVANHERVAYSTTSAAGIDQQYALAASAYMVSTPDYADITANDNLSPPVADFAFEHVDGSHIQEVYSNAPYLHGCEADVSYTVPIHAPVPQAPQAVDVLNGPGSFNSDDTSFLFANNQYSSDSSSFFSSYSNDTGTGHQVAWSRTNSRAQSPASSVTSSGSSSNYSVSAADYFVRESCASSLLPNSGGAGFDSAYKNDAQRFCFSAERSGTYAEYSDQCAIVPFLSAHDHSAPVIVDNSTFPSNGHYYPTPTSLSANQCFQ